jgi:hypothetical protein
VGVGGTVVTAVLTGRASYRAAAIIEEERVTRALEYQHTETPIPPPEEPSKTLKVKLVWKLYLPPVASGVLTVTSIVVANKISSKKIAALAVAGGISERALQEYKEKVVEKLGERQNQKLHDEIAQNRVSNHPLGSQEIVLAGTGEVLCYDMTTGRYFQSTMETIKAAENKINHEMLNHMGVSLAEFHEEIGLPATNYTDSVGWSGADLIKVIFSTTMSPDKRPCIAIDFERPPNMEYSRLN